MAWVFSKAENLLNTLDQSASNVLTTTPTQEKKSSHSNGGTGHYTQNDSSTRSSSIGDSFTSSSPFAQISTSSSSHNLTATDLANTANIRRTPSDGSLNSGSPVAQKSRSSKLRTDQDDEKLFEFLNKPSTTGRSSPQVGDKRKDRKTVGNSGSGVAMNGRHSRQSSTSSTMSSKSARVEGSTQDLSPSPTSDQQGKHWFWPFLKSLSGKMYQGSISQR